MVVFGCLICKEAFYPDEHYSEDKTEEKNIPVITSCGHYFHLSCIQGAFIHESVNDNSTGTKRKSCPFSKCGKHLHNTSLIKIHPEEIHHDSSKQKIAELQCELLYWKHCVENTASFESGDKVTFSTGNGNPTGVGIVKQIMVEIQLENAAVGTNSTELNNTTNHAVSWREILSNKLIHSIHGTLVNGNGSSIVLPKNKVSLAPSTSQMSQMQRQSTPIKLLENRKLGNVPNPAEIIKKYPTIEEYSHLRPKWEAGDRIYLSNEKEYATIKWIGSRHYTFVVVIEFDNPVGDDDGIQSDDLPFIIKKGFGRKLTINELNETARKVSKNSASRIFTKIHQWGSERIRNGSARPSIFNLDISTPHENM